MNTAPSASLVKFLEEQGLSFENESVRVVRHASSTHDVEQIYGLGIEWLELYQAAQGSLIFNKSDVLVSFIRTEHTQAKFVGLYRVVDVISTSEPGFKFPTCPPEVLKTLDGAHYYYNIARDEEFDQFRDNLVIEWGAGTRAWVQTLPASDKAIVAATTMHPDVKAAERRNPSWSRDELILALDLYFRHSPLSISKKHPEVIKLSDVLNQLGVRLGRIENEKFRNPNGVYMKLCNFLRFDPTYTGSGLKAGNKMEEEVWNRYAADRKQLTVVAEGIKAGVLSKSEPLPPAEQEEESTFAEGTVLYRMHRTRERKPEAIRKAKQRAKKLKGKLTCEVCDFDFAEVWGEEYIECHHTKPVSQLRPGQETRIEDLALLCANCHRMAHKREAWLNPVELRKALLSKVSTTSSVGVN